MTDAAMASPAPLDAEEAARLRAAKRDRIAKWALPVIVMVLTLILWDRLVVWYDIKHYILPAPGRVAEALVADWAILGPAAWATIQIAAFALLAAVIGGVGLAVFFTQSRLFELSFYPYAVILQVTPIIAIAPLLRIYIDSVYGVLILCAWIVAFFPILSNTTLGLNSADHNLRDLFRIYGATRWQRLRYLQLPSALPYFLGGLRIAGGLSLIGAVVAEFVVGTAGQSYGLASRILEASYRLNIPRLYAALLLISAIGVVIFAALSLLSHLLLRKWHESALKRET